MPLELPLAMKERLPLLLTTLKGTAQRRAFPMALCLWLGLAALWLLDITGSGVGLLPARLLTLAAVGSSGVALLSLSTRLWSREQAWGRLLLFILTGALAIGFTGLAFEVGEGYYTDEGHYLEQARRVNSGRLFVGTMVYPHLLYYLEGFVLWISHLFPAITAWWAASLFGVTTKAAVPWLVLRLVTATLGILTVVPVFLAAEKLAGRLAAGLSSGALIFAMHFHEGFHINICDVPSGTFAAFCSYFVVRLLTEERTDLYLFAGVFSGLAAAAKHPAGIAAVAIVAVWAFHRLRALNWGSGLLNHGWLRNHGWLHSGLLNFGLLWAGLASLDTYIDINPSVFVYPEATLTGTRGLFFGLQLYSEGGWIGVTPPSNTIYYLQKLLLDFRWPLVLFAAIGLFGLPSKVRLHLLVFAVFPLTFLGLLISMKIVVVRNLFPLIPALAVLLGVAASGVPALLERLLPLTRSKHRGVVAALIFSSLALPALATSRQALAMSRPGTRQLMQEWIRTFVPRGAGLLHESYTPRLRSVIYRLQGMRFAHRFPEAIFNNPRFDYILFSSHAHTRFFRPENQTVKQAQWYRDFFAQQELAHEVKPAALRLGPRLLLYRLKQDLEIPTEQNFPAVEAFLPNPRMLKKNQLHFERQGQFALFKAPFRAGHQRLLLDPPARGRVQVKNLAGTMLADLELIEGHAEIELPEKGKYFFYLFLAEGSTLDNVRFLQAAPSAQ
jgi:hypothetical protein